MEIGQSVFVGEKRARDGMDFTKTGSIRGKYSVCMLLHLSRHIWVFPKIGIPPNHQF